MSLEHAHFGVVGGGLMGLTVALRLAQRGQRVTLLEAADHVGGLADSWQLDDVAWDRHYHVTLLSDTWLRAILAELGLDDHMRWVQTRTGFIVDGQLYSLSNSWEFLRFPPLGLVDKFRLGWTIWRASRMRDWQRLEQIPVGQWLISLSGQRTFDRIWLPLLKAKLGQAWQRTSAAFIWATIQRMYAARSAGVKREMFGYLPGGYGRMLAAFGQRLDEVGVLTRTNCRVQQIARGPGGEFTISTAAGEPLKCDRVVVTTPAPIAARACPQLQPDEIQRLAGVEYLGIICASLLLRKPLADYYVTNITDAAPFTGVIEMTQLVDPAAFGGRSLVYLPKYLAAGDAEWSQSDEAIRATFLAALERLYPNFSADDVLAFRVSRVRHVFALPTLGYSQRAPRCTTSVPGLFVVNSAQIVNGTLNVNETVKFAESSVEALCRPLSAGTGLESSCNATDAGELIARP
jgi:protoporphyrinogen oxidase